MRPFFEFAERRRPGGGARFVAASLLALVLLGIPATASAQSPSPTPSPTPSGSATPTATPSPSPRSEPTSSPSPTPTDPGALPGEPLGGLEVVQTTEFLAQVGDAVRYGITISNTSAEEIHDIVVIDLVPDEVDVVGVPVTDSVDAVQLGTHRGQEDIVWIIGSISAGGVIELSWSGEIVEPGDLEAVNSVSATAREVPGSSESAATYLGYVKSLEIERGRAPAPSFVRRTVLKRVPVEGAPAPTVPGALPATGAAVAEMIGVGLVLIALGSLLLGLSGSRLRSRAAVAFLLVALAGCSGVSNSVAPQRAEIAGSIEAPKSNQAADRVLGFRIERDRAADVESSAVEPGPGFETVEVVELVPVPNEGSTVELESREADNSMQLGWDLTARAITSAVSSRLISASSTVDLLTAVTETEDGLVAMVEVFNASDEDRLHVDGSLHLDVIDADGAGSSFESEPLDETLEPGGSTKAQFTFLLPTGEFDIDGAFEAAVDP